MVTKIMKSRAAALTLVNSIITALLLLVAFLTPLLFSPLTTEFYETPKLLFLGTTVLLLITFWSISWILQGKVTFTRTPLDIPLLLFLIVVIASTFFSSSRYISFYGNFPRVHGSTVSLILYILLYFIATSHLKSKAQIKTLIYAFITSTTIAAVISVLAYFGVYPLATLVKTLSFTKIVNFNPTGSSFSASVLMLIFLPLLLRSLVISNKFIPQPIALVLTVIFAISLVFIAPFNILILAGFTTVAVLYLLRSHLNAKNLPLIVAPILLAGLLMVFSMVSIKGLETLQLKRNTFPREIQLPLGISWKISASAFRDNPFLGSGPATYLFDFTNYKPIEQNATPYWNIRFDSSFNEFLQTFATLGILGLVALGFLVVMVLVFAVRALQDTDDILSFSLAVASILTVVLLLIHASTVISVVAMLLIFAMLMAVNKSTGKVEEISLGINVSKANSSNLNAGDLLPLIIFVLVLGLLFIPSYGAVWNLKNIAVADYYHRQALNTASSNGVNTYNLLVKAEQYNPYVDLYRTDLAQTNFALANLIASRKAPSEASPEGSLTDDDKKNIQQLLSQAISEGQTATALSPKNPQNWEILASIYRQISGVAQNALQFSLDSYGRAIQLDPLNPLLRLNVGGVYYSVKNYDLAIRFFTDSINLKPDFANGYYNLSVALRDKGDLKNSQLAAEKVVSLLDSKSADYNIAAAYLADLKARIATGSAQQSEITPPAAQQNGALQQEKLPKVLDLPTPEKITTPSAVPSPKSTPTPSPSASPEASPVSQ